MDELIADPILEPVRELLGALLPGPSGKQGSHPLLKLAAKPEQCCIINEVEKPMILQSTQSSHVQTSCVRMMITLTKFLAFMGLLTESGSPPAVIENVAAHTIAQVVEP